MIVANSRYSARAERQRNESSRSPCPHPATPPVYIRQGYSGLITHHEFNLKNAAHAAKGSRSLFGRTVHKVLLMVLLVAVTVVGVWRCGLAVEPPPVASNDLLRNEMPASADDLAQLEIVIPVTLAGLSRLRSPNVAQKVIMGDVPPQGMKHSNTINRPAGKNTVRVSPHDGSNTPAGTDPPAPEGAQRLVPRVLPAAGRPWGKQLCATYVGGLPATMPALTRNIKALGNRCEWALLSYTGDSVASEWRSYLAALPREWGHTVRLVANMDSLVDLRPHNLTIKFLSKWAMLDEKVARFLGDYDRVLVRGLRLLRAAPAGGLLLPARLVV